jgi:hypothetical protein
MSIRTSTIPGLKDIFPLETTTYEELVRGIGSDQIILMCSALNSELTCYESADEIEKRIIGIITRNFTEQQFNHIRNAMILFKKNANGVFHGRVFFRNYLIEMILRELNNYHEADGTKSAIEQEYLFFKAYLKIIDEVNEQLETIANVKSIDRNSPNFIYKHFWMLTVSRFELFERGNMVFELLKCACFLDYAKDVYRDQLGDYLNSMNFRSPGELMSSFSKIYEITQISDPNDMFHKYTAIKLSQNTNEKHLLSLTIKPNCKETLNFSDLKVKPIYFSPLRDAYIVVDNYFAHKKVFRGPYFELFHRTNLKPSSRKYQDEAFNNYSQQISNVLENRCLKPIISLLAKEIVDKIYFDDGSDSVPDGYLRIGRDVFLFEYKAYVFPEKLAKKPNFDELINYYNSKFVIDGKGKEKGIHQLRKQIAIIKKGGFSFDPEVNVLLKSGEINIYPILTYNDFNFGISGLNHYLNNLLENHSILKILTV